MFIKTRILVLILFNISIPVLISACFTYVDCSVLIDNDHFRQDSACGKLPTVKPTSRISNANEAKIHYPWIVLVLRQNEYTKLKESNCGGSIITKTTAVTAGHCVCGFMTENDKKAPENTRKKIRCKGGKIKDPVTVGMPNEITVDNRIKVGAGNMDKTKLKWFEILYAHVYTEYDEEFKDTDLAVVKTTNLKPFYSQRHLSKDFSIGPICLSAKSSNLNECKIEIAGWGVRYGEAENKQMPPGDRQPLQNKHACTTNPYGPFSHRIKHCDVHYLKSQEWSCNMDAKLGTGITKFTEYLKNNLKLQDKDVKRLTEQQGGKYYPPGYDSVKCDEAWKKANDIMNKKINEPHSEKIRKIWKDTAQIDIGVLNKGEFFKIKTCYKKELFMENGWCFIKNGIFDANWGFCDSSCKLMKKAGETPDTTPNVYHKMTWKVDNTSPLKCTSHARHKKKWFVCVKQLFPEVNVARFLVDVQENLSFLKQIQEPSSDYAKHHEFGYQQPCVGDSGSGNWVFEEAKDRAVLVGIVRSAATDDNWCSSPSLMTKIIYPDFLHWIKKAANIIA